MKLILYKFIFILSNLFEIFILSFFFRILTQTQLAMVTMQQFGFKNKDIDEIKAIFDTNHYLLLVSIFVAFIHVRK